MQHPHGQRGTWRTARAVLSRRGTRVTAVLGSAALLGSLSVAVPASAAAGSAVARLAGARDRSPATCRLANGIKHVVQIGFDNVHFFRDNPNVPSDLEMMPNLLHFMESNGAFLSNSHTPLIAHTGDDLLTTATGLYGDRHGDPISNDYRSYNTDGTTDPATVFTYWNDAIDDTARTPDPGHDTNPNLAYSPVPPATSSPATKPDTVTPAPLGSVHQSGLQCRRDRDGEPGTGEPLARPGRVVRPELARGSPAQRRHRPVQGPRDR